MTDSCTHTQQGGGVGGGGRAWVTKRLTAAQQHWSGRVVVIWTCVRSNTQLERFNSLLQASCVCNFSIWQIWTEPDLFCSFFVLFFFCFCPTAPFIPLFRTNRASHCFFVTHIVWILSSAKPTVNVYVIVYWKLYLHMRLYVVSLCRVLILYIVDKCEFYRTRALFVRSHQVSSSTWFRPEVIGQCRGCSCRGAGPWETPDKKKKT